MISEMEGVNTEIATPRETAERDEEAADLGYELTALSILMRPVLVDLKRYRVKKAGEIEAAMELMRETGRRLIGYGEPWAIAS